jgi:hypothetical protein
VALSERTIREQQELQVPAIRAAFLRTVRDIASAAQIQRVAELISAGRVDEIPGVLGIGPATWAELLESIRVAYIGGGVMESGAVAQSAAAAGIGGTLRIRFDVRAPRAEAWLREHSSQLVTRINAEQLQAIRDAVSAGTVRGQNPRATALDIVGRIDSQTGRRTGGIVGLTPQQAQFVENARVQLLSGDPDQLEQYLGRQLRDRRLDGIVRRAIRDGKPIKLRDVERLTARYADSLLRLRGENIARTEALQAFNAARDESILQAADLGIVDLTRTVKIWRTASDARVRDSHGAMAGQTVDFRQPFRTPSGALMMRPGDGSMGAGAGEIVNCRCVSQTRVDFLAGLSDG